MNKSSILKTDYRSKEDKDLSALAYKILHAPQIVEVQDNNNNINNNNNKSSKEIQEELLNISAIFYSFDIDNDEYINRSQLIEALHALGIVPTEKLIKNYIDESITLSSNTNTEIPIATTSSNKELSSVKHKNQVNLPTFIKLSLTELNKLSHDLDFLFDLMSPDGGNLSVIQLRHLLVDTIRPGSLNKNEFDLFLQALNIDITKINVNEECIERNLIMKQFSK
jgi:hypothetical protein